MYFRLNPGSKGEDELVSVVLWLAMQEEKADGPACQLEGPHLMKKKNTNQINALEAWNRITVRRI